MKSWLVPSSFIVPPRGIENAALAVHANPSPWFASVSIGLQIANSVLQHGAVLVVVFVMNVGLVPARERFVTIGNRVLDIG